jgi:hypothetical protein
MQRAVAAALLFVMTLPALAAKITGSTTLKDSQPYGSKDKEHKHQGYDLFFDAQGKSYTCRTDPNKSMKATDFVVGSQMNYEIDGDETKLRTLEKKEVKCKIVRVEQSPAQ